MKHRLEIKYKRLRRRLYLMIPEWIRKRDFELFTATLCILAGIPLLTNGVDASSMEAALWGPVVKAWAAVLTLAPIAVVMGIWRAHKHQKTQKAIKWLRVEASGLRLLTYAGYLYAVIVFMSPFPTEGQEYIITLFALTCHSRATYLNIKAEDHLALIKTIINKEVD